MNATTRTTSAAEIASPDWASYGEAFANRLAAIRRARGLTQEALARAAGVHRNEISNLERNVDSRGEPPADPRTSTVYALARALGVELALLLPGAMNPFDGSSTERTLEGGLRRAHDEVLAILGRRIAVESAVIDAGGRAPAERPDSTAERPDSTAERPDNTAGQPGSAVDQFGSTVHSWTQ